MPKIGKMHARLALQLSNVGWRLALPKNVKGHTIKLCLAEDGFVEEKSYDLTRFGR
jgi:hypothetical protein